MYTSKTATCCFEIIVPHPLLFHVRAETAGDEVLHQPDLVLLVAAALDSALDHQLSDPPELALEVAKVEVLEHSNVRLSCIYINITQVGTGETYSN